MECDKCGEKTYVIFITEKHEKLCDSCWSKIIKKSEWKLVEEQNERYKKENNN